eukprot:SAG31_NODE_1930_length_6881_cov_6.976998_10_plen_176_part_00
MFAFILTGNHSGLGWHVHGQSWLMLTAGVKRWFVYPPGMLQSGADRGHPLMNAADWLTSGAYEAALERRYSNGQPVLKECPQRPGELFYLPASWAHQTLNIGGSVGVGAQSVFASREESEELKTSAATGDPGAQLSLGQIMVQDERLNVRMEMNGAFYSNELHSANHVGHCGTNL